MKKILNITFVTVILISTACQKDWLDIKNNSKLIVPTTLKDMRLLLNNTTVFQISYIGLGEIAADNLSAQSSHLSAASTTQQAAYQWSESVFEGALAVSEWDVCYNQIFTANVVLEGLANIEPTTANAKEWNDLKGAALFFRAKAFFDLATMFTMPYRADRAQSQAGIPLKLSTDLTTKIERANLRDTYAQIINDLNQAADLLRNLNAYPTDASRPAALGLLARVYLTVGDYSKAKSCADSFLAINGTLIDFNTITLTAARPFQRFNTETVFYSTLTNYNLFTNAFIDPKLIALYHANDLRLPAFFKAAGNQQYNFKGNYSASAIPFSGISPAELLLVRAECYARTNQISLALADLETLLKKRYKTGSYVRPNLTTQAQTLNYVLEERRKELVLRGLRWIDLRRLTAEADLAVTINRTVGGKSIQLAPYSNRYAFAIPNYIIVSSKIQQNER